MAFIEDITKGSMATVLVGIGVALAAPTILPALASGLRPLAKAVIKGGVLVYDAAKEAVAEAGEQLNDLVAEARTELAESAKAEATAAPGAVKEASKKSH